MYAHIYSKISKSVLNKSAGNKGFTLIEILIAIFIFSIIVSTVFLSYNSLFSNTKDVGDTAYLSRAAGSVMSRIKQDLTSIYIPIPPLYDVPDINSEPDPYRFEGKEDYFGTKTFPVLRFASFSHLNMGEKETKMKLARMVYYVKETKDRGYVLKRSDKLYPNIRYEKEKSLSEEFDNPANPVLCENLISLSFKYIDKEGKEHDTWNSDSSSKKYSTPSVVKIYLEIEKGAISRNFATAVKLPAVREEQ